MKIGLIDFDSKIPNLALMKISTFYKNHGAEVYLNDFPKNVYKVYCSVLFTWNRLKAANLKSVFENIEFGGTGWDLETVLPAEIEQCKPDYNLYSVEDIASKMKGIGTKVHKVKKATEIVNAGIGFTSRGCIRNCGFCFVPRKEGNFKDVAEIKDLINPKSNILILHDNNITADPFCIDKLHEIRERNLIVDINQGCDVRLVNEDIAKALGEVKHLRSVHYAWDLMGFEQQVMDGIKTLSKFIKPYRHMCFMLVGFNTTFEEDLYRFRKLVELKVDPFVMIYNKEGDTRLRHFARWVNSRIYKTCIWNEYYPWIKVKQEFETQIKLF